ncbi:MAG: sulfatase-like hydrolase/transferase [Bryobacteraceae bacterium]|jgi:arylsulfatase A-like enzyme
MQLSRRHFFLGSLALPSLASVKKESRPQPNLVLILVDGLPSWILGCYGNKTVRTPNIDALSQTGVRLLNHCAAAPAPGPGRDSLLTGRTALQLAGANAIPSTAVSLAKILGGAGYASGAADSGPAGAVAAAARQFLDAQAAGKPFFLTAGFTDLTPPYEGVAQKYLDMYVAAGFESEFPADPPAANARRGKEMLPHLLASLRRVAAAITAVDDGVGSIVAKLTERKLLDDTLIVFTSPCGSLYGHHGLWDSGEASDPVNMYQESVATPMIWSWPVRLAPQTTRPESVSACDFVPAICEFASAPPPKGGLCGRSYVPLLTNTPLPKKQPWRNVVYSHLESTDMVRDSRFKLVLRDGGKGPNEIYDLQTDPHERTNGYDDGGFTTIRNDLTAQLAAWKKSCSA